MGARAWVRTGYRCIDVDAARQLVQRCGMLVLDVRDPESFATGHIDSAICLTDANLDSILAHTARSTPILIYCCRGYESQGYAEVFSDFRFLEVYSLDSGYEGWRVRENLHAWLRQHGFVHIDGTTTHGMTPLMHASRCGDDAIVDALLDAGANVHATNNDGNNALWHACIHGSSQIVDTLIATGIDVNRQNVFGATCLMCACLRGRTALAERLLAAGASLLPVGPDGLTVLDMATTTECGELLRQHAHAGRVGKATERVAAVAKGT